MYFRTNVNSGKCKFWKIGLSWQRTNSTQKELAKSHSYPGASTELTDPNQQELGQIENAKQKVILEPNLGEVQKF